MIGEDEGAVLGAAGQVAPTPGQMAPGNAPFIRDPAHPTFGLDRDDRLPWLEAEDRYADPHAVDGKRVAGAVAGGLALLAVIVGGVWWGTHRHPVGTPVADGSTLAAPAGAVKEAPADPGGKTFDGTGDSSFAMSQGKTRPAQLAGDAAKSASEAAKSAGAMASAAALAAASAGADAAGAGKAMASQAAGKMGGKMGAGGAAIGAGVDAAPAIVKHTPSVTLATPAAAPMVDTGAGTGGLVQVGAYSSQASAEAGWARLSGAHDMLSSLHHRIVEGQADIGTVFRLQAITAPGGGGALCDKLRAINVACQVKK